VERLVLADVDPLVASFWETAAFDSTWLIEAMRAVEPSVALWDEWRQRDTSGDRRASAMKCLFLNRTTFSGILHGRAGPLGGRTQQSEYKIDCRFGKDGLATRIRKVADLAAAGRLVDVWNLDWHETLRQVENTYGASLAPKDIAVYLDPPYVGKAQYLYEWSWNSDEHTRLAKTLDTDFSHLHWVLSYDNHETITELYGEKANCAIHRVPYKYSAGRGAYAEPARNELVITNISVDDAVLAERLNTPPNGRKQ
jgi:DNA adenine methylase